MELKFGYSFATSLEKIAYDLSIILLKIIYYF